MNIKHLLKAPIKQTLIFIGIALAINVLTYVPLIYLTRLEVRSCVSVECLTVRSRSTPLAITKRVLGDFNYMSELAAELGVVLLITQGITQSRKHHKNSRKKQLA